ncbi:MAG TPA: hypothetical protein ENI51_10255 [Candidatus Atribacteria bacterium]|nr:hypothetical protein [Candidatus Atribacteria bacterium]
MNTKQVLDALKNKYDDHGHSYAFLTQVGNSTGFSCNRWADAIVMSLWESRGLEIIGFEIKVSRTDWLRELKNPAKADPIYQYCDSWYLVLGDPKILRFGELPMGWGLMVPHTKNTLKTVVPAKRKENPKPINRRFLAAILRRVVQQLPPEAVLRNEYARGYEDGKKDGQERAKNDVGYAEKKYKTLVQKIKDFEKASGVNIDSWTHNPKEIGEAVRLVLNGKYMEELNNLEYLKKRALRIAEEIDKILTEHKKEIL